MIAVAIVALIVTGAAVAVAGLVAVRTNQLLRDDNAALVRAVLSKNVSDFDRPEQARTQAQTALNLRLLDTDESVQDANVME